MEKLLPVLKPADYYKNDTNLYFKEKLFNSIHSPIIIYGTDDGISISYQSAIDNEDFNSKFPSIKIEAIENIKAIEAEIKIQDAQGTKVAFVAGIEYGCEKILDKEFMKKVANSVGSESLMVGIPYKGYLLATDSNSELRHKFPSLIQKYFNNPQQEPISDKVFLVQNGEIVAIGGENISEKEESNFSLSENSKTNNYTVNLKSNSIDELVSDVNNSYQQILIMVMNTKKFGGEIIYNISGKLTLNNQLIDKCNSISNQIEENEILEALTKDIASTKLNIKFNDYRATHLIIPNISNTSNQ